jgi:ribokinase
LLGATDVTESLTELRLASDDVVLTSAEISEDCRRAAAESCAAAGARLIYNLAPASPLPPWEALSNAIVVVNEIEAVQVIGASSLPEAIAALADRVAAVVVTRGARGVRLAKDGTTVDIPAPTVNLVDSTGAGDAFCGGLAADLTCGRQLVEAVSTALSVGSFAVTAAGARGALPTRRDLMSMRTTSQGC